MAQHYTPRKTLWDNVLGFIKKVGLWIATAVPRFLYWMTEGSARPVVFGFLGLYFFLANTQSYYRTFGGNGSFIPSPIEAGTFATLFERNADGVFLVTTSPFIVGLLVSLATQIACTFAWRDVSPKKAIADYLESAKHKIYITPGDADLDITHHKHRQAKSAGMKAVRLGGFGFLLATTIDAVANFYDLPWKAYPFFFPKLGLLVWAIMLVLGAEICWAIAFPKED